MSSAAELLAANSTANATSSGTATSDVAVDAELFAKELRNRLQSLNPTTKEKVQEGQEKLAAALPGLTVSSRNGLANFGSAASYFVRTGDNSTVSMTPDIPAQIADDDALLQSLRNVITNTFEAGKSQNLVNAGGEKTSRNLVVDTESIRYVEVQRGRGNTTLSVAMLQLETQRLLADSLDELLSSLNGGGRSGSSRSSSQQSIFDLLFSANQSGLRSGQNSGLFSGLVSQSDSWRLEFTAFNSSQLFNQVTEAPGRSGTMTGVNVQLEVAIEQYSASGAAASGMDLMTYMQIMGLCDPLVFDLADEGINLTSAEDGVYFDIRGDGTPVKSAFIQGNNAFLFLDQNGNGSADDANELFGDHGGFANGFAKLAQYDENQDGVIDENDSVYSQLRLWRDLNGDGMSQLEEALSLSDAGIKSISLRHDDSRQLDAHGNVIGEKSTFTRTDGSQGLVADAWLRYLK